ncbi:hypothetical protein ACIBSW_15770 [Actinoplanes sp. NPDC049668]|uniref:hypothetical protein n=1 Tax=Actinoplanes sp. NPDC049668 TaxID=3363904 RepID=UPI0037A30D2D
MLERIIDGGEPYYAFDPAWGDDEAAQMSNGSGDEWTAVFTGDGTFIRVFAHESSMSPYRDPDGELWPGLLDGLPEVFRPQLDEPAFGDEIGQFVATAVLWRRAGDDCWHAGTGIVFPPSRGPYDNVGPDGAAQLQILLDDIVDQYVEFAGDYYETAVDRSAVEHIVARRPLTEAVARALNPDVDFAALREDVTAIGYPVVAR